MAKSQMEINYDNALAAKSKALNDYNLEKAENTKLIKSESDAKLNFDKIYWFDCKGTRYPFIDLPEDKKANLPQACSFPMANVWVNILNSPSILPSINKAKEFIRIYNEAIANTDAEEIILGNKKDSYDDAVKKATEAFKDWQEWKMANMTAQEAQDFLDVEQSAAGFGLRMSAWKWTAVGIGVLLFAWGAWWLIKRMKGVKVPIPTIAV